MMKGLIQCKGSEMRGIRWRGYLDVTRPRRTDTKSHPSVYEPEYVNDNDRGSIKVKQGDGRNNWTVHYAWTDHVDEFRTKTDAQLYVERYYIELEAR